MMKILKRVSLFLLIGLLSGCGKKETPKPNTLDPSTLSGMPVLSITTVTDGKNVMDFVTKPVASHVSEAIASWTPNYDMPPAPYYETCTVTLTDTDKTVVLDAVTADVKVRGNWTTAYDKKPLRIKFTEPQSLLGLNGGETFKNWVLLAEYKDASMLRNKTALAVARELLAKDGLYASDATFVEVVINGYYWGVYLLAEQQQVNKDRVDITEVPEGYTGTDIGYFLEFDSYFWTEDPLQQFRVDYADNAELVSFEGEDGAGDTMKCLSDPKYGYKSEIGFTIKNDIYSKEQHDFIASYVNHVYEIMYAAAYKDEAYVFDDTYSAIRKTTEITPREAVERVVNVFTLADAYLINELLCDADVYLTSFYMSADFGPKGDKKLTFQAHWDFDSAMGNKNRCIDGTGFYAASIVPDVNGGPGKGGEYNSINPWLAVLAYEDWYQDVIRENWTSFYDSGVFDRIYTMIENDKTTYADAFLRNYDRWDNIRNNHSFAMELSAPAAACKTQAEAADFLLDWLKKRVEFMNSVWR